jgi:hypothetical protein
METQLENLTQNEQQAIELFKTFVEDVAKFRSKGTASAVVRARKSASDLTKLLKVVRKELQLAKVAKVEEKRQLAQTSCGESCGCE